jgi:hypothetical protein
MSRLRHNGMLEQDPSRLNRCEASSQDYRLNYSGLNSRRFRSNTRSWRRLSDIGLLWDITVFSMCQTWFEFMIRLRRCKVFSYISVMVPQSRARLYGSAMGSLLATRLFGLSWNGAEKKAYVARFFLTAAQKS